jgi:hypothetical protein
VGVAHPTSRFEVAGTETLQEYPPRGMTGYETYMEGHGVFRASASTVRNQTLTNAGNAAWHAFDSEAINTYWININDDDDYKYAGTSNTYSGISQLSPETPLGEYITLECPYKIIPQMVGFKPYDNLNHQPLNAVVYGSNDGYTWTFISSLQNMSGYSTSYIKTFSLNNTSKEGYRYVSFITTQVTGTSPYLRFFTYRIYGTPAPSSLEDGHLTLGKALTLPRVSGHPAGAETPRAESLVVHYDTTVDSVVSGTTVVDVSGNGINGTLTNGAAYSSTDRALTFDGASDEYINISDVGNPSGNWTHSVSFWLKPQYDGSGNDVVFRLGPGSDNEAIGFYYNATAISYYFYGNDFASTYTLQDKWYHITLTYDGNERNVYINGGQNRFSTTTGGGDLNLGGNDGMRIGTNQGTSAPMTGSISNFKLWGGVALTAEEVAMEYALGRTGKSLNLTDTALCLGGTVPRAQLDVRGVARFDGFVGIDGNVGIGTTNPTSKLYIQDDNADTKMTIRGGGNTVNDSNVSIELFETSTNFYGATIQYCGTLAIQGLRFGHHVNTATPRFDMAIDRNSGNVGIGTVNPLTPLHIKQGENDGGGSAKLEDQYQAGITVERSDAVNRWIQGINALNNYHFWYDVGGSEATSKAFFDQDGSNNVDQNFTGQHRTFIKDVPFSQAGDLEGLIVSASNNKYIKMSGGIEVGSNAITTNESLPVVSLSTKVNDKKCFGVISASEDPETRENRFGNIVSISEKETGDTRVYINSVGEGAMWVVNTAGALESGDYITTSNVAGYGQGQDDDILHNYTVAKITMDCDFNPPDIPVQRILKELSNITYWYQLEDATSNAYDRTVEETYYTKDRRVEVYGHVDEQSNVFVPPDHDLELYSKTQVNTVSKEVYDALPVDEQALYDSNTFTYTQIIEVSPEVWEDLEPEEQNTYVHRYYKIYVDEVPMETPDAVERTRTVYKKVVNDTKVEPERPEDYLSEVRQEWVNVLDEHGQLQWEDVPWGETEPAYKIRYLDASGNLTTRHNAVHLAAFVGVTYHCG